MSNQYLTTLTRLQVDTDTAAQFDQRLVDLENDIIKAIKLQMIRIGRDVEVVDHEIGRYPNNYFYEIVTGINTYGDFMLSCLDIDTKSISQASSDSEVTIGDMIAIFRNLLLIES